jgi:hypothetical protein
LANSSSHKANESASALVTSAFRLQLLLELLAGHRVRHTFNPEH